MTPIEQILNPMHLRQHSKKLINITMEQIEPSMNVRFQNCFLKVKVLNVYFCMILLIPLSINVGGNTHYNHLEIRASFGSPSQNSVSSTETYIILLEDQIPPAEFREIVSALEERGAHISREYSHSINGFTIQIPSEMKSEVLDFLRSDDRVVSIESDKSVTLPIFPGP